MKLNPELTNLVKEYQSSKEYKLIYQLYGTCPAVNKYIEDYISLLKDEEIDHEFKCNYIRNLITERKEKFIDFLYIVESLNIMDLNFSSSGKEIDHIIKRKCLGILNRLKDSFENKDFLKQLSREEVYNIYTCFNDLHDHLINNLLTDKLLQEYEDFLSPIYNKFWTHNFTNVNEYKGGEKFKFLIHSTNATEAFDNNLRGDRISCSYITDKQMGSFRNYGYILDVTDSEDIVTIGEKDIHSNEDDYQSIYDLSSNKLITPDQLEKKMCNMNKDSDINLNLYNEVLKKEFNPTAVFCFTTGDREINSDYETAKKIALEQGLKIIEIDRTKYRAKTNNVSSMTYKEILTEKEKDKMVRSFLIKYYKYKNEIDNFRFLEFDYINQRDIIIDIITEFHENNKSSEDMFCEYDLRLRKRNDLILDFSDDVKKLEALVLIYQNLDKSKKHLSASNELFTQLVNQEIDQISTEIKILNDRLHGNNNRLLSNNSIIYQKNILIDKAMNTYTPYTTEKLTINGEEIILITGYKTKEELLDEKNKILSKIKESEDYTTFRSNHANKIVDLIYNEDLQNSYKYKFVAPKGNSDIKDSVSKTHLLKSERIFTIIENESFLHNYEEISETSDKIDEEIEKLSYMKNFMEHKYSYEYTIKSNENLSADINKCNEDIQENMLVKEDKEKELSRSYEKIKELEGKTKIGRLYAKFFKKKQIKDMKNTISSIEYNIFMNDWKMETNTSNLQFYNDYKNEINNEFEKNTNMSLTRYSEIIQSFNNIDSVSIYEQLSDLKLNKYDLDRKKEDLECDYGNYIEIKNNVRDCYQQLGIIKDEKIESSELNEEQLSDLVNTTTFTR